jgi:nifR3 family TIM-barrel protein
MARSLTDPWTLGGLPIPNRVVLAPLAGIGNWFVRLQARRHGAGLVVSEMVSSFAIHYGNRRTLTELLRIEEAERAVADAGGGGRGPVAIQLFGQDPEIMRRAAAVVAERGADLIDLNMGCPVPKVMKTGAGAALLKDPDTAVAVARAAREGSGLPVTVKLRAGLRPGETAPQGLDVARRLAEEAGVAGITFHPRSAAVRHKGVPDYDLAARLVQELPVPVVVSGGMQGAEHIRWVFEHTGCAAVMLARGALGNPWLFEEVLGVRDEGPVAEEVVAEWLWVVDRAVEHLGEDRAAGYLRKFHPWYVERLGGDKQLQNSLQRAGTVAEQRTVIAAQGPVLSSPAA